jgi:hypothetical protein
VCASISVLPAPISLCTDIVIQNVSASSGGSPGFAFDGNIDTFWKSEDAASSSIQFQFEKLYNLERLTLRTPTVVCGRIQQLRILFTDGSAANQDSFEQTCTGNTAILVDLQGKQTASMYITFRFTPCPSQSCTEGIAYSEITACGIDSSYSPSPPPSPPLAFLPPPPPPRSEQTYAVPQLAAFGAQTTIWTTVISRGTYGYTDLGESNTNTLFTQTGVFRRFCSWCVATHQTVYYVRTTAIPALATTFSAYRQMRDRWTHVNSGNTNLLGTDLLRCRLPTSHSRPRPPTRCGS